MLLVYVHRWIEILIFSVHNNFNYSIIPRKSDSWTLPQLVNK